MKTQLSKNNPFENNRYAFAFEKLKKESKCLDYGCYDGKFMMSCSQNKKINFIGVDKNIDIVNANPFNQKIVNIVDNAVLPFENNRFDTVTILDVIEHIYNQDIVLQEIHRVLKADGNLILTVPKKHFFSFLDLGNLKFVFPRIHKFYYSLKYSKNDYEHRYFNNPSGLIGDVEKEKMWHQHFSEKEMEELLVKNGFQVKYFDGSGLFNRVFSVAKYFKLGFPFSQSLIEADLKKHEASNLFCEATKI